LLTFSVLPFSLWCYYPERWGPPPPHPTPWSGTL